MSDPRELPGPERPTSPRDGHRLHVHSWLDSSIISVAFLAFASGFGEFAAVAVLGGVARTFGRVVEGASISERAGLSGTELGVGLAVLRLASLGGLPLAGLADRFGRRITLLATCALGLAFTVAAAGSPGYWWFVAIFACGRPFLSATNALTGVSAAELTGSRDRTKAVSLITAGYGIGAGAGAIIHGLAGGTLSFRGVFALAAVPLALLLVVRRWVIEPDRFLVAAAAPERPLPVLGPVGTAFRRPLAVIAALTLAVGVITGPANSFLFVYAENVLVLSGVVISAMVLAAGVTGLAGLVMGSWLADRMGRRPTSALAMTAMAGLGVLTYSGSRPGVVAGFVLSVLASATFAPAIGALSNELFPTSVRASAAGWLVGAGVLGAVGGLLAFGAVADATSRFGVAALVTFLPALAAVSLLGLLPETRGREPEDLWPGIP